ncbi:MULTISPECIES: ATP-binding cassette domain-containing protein [unclassified Helicobacter]|uniref:ABC transporter ATP-binding protein n=1 Tax=unclassified Helicobacter TaxID=2593540 RepID=UPI000DCDE8DF|nr:MULTISPECIES: ATP-binding cassette domain-containing protein [unclassified Helicobacter]MDY4426986.1 ATP-binding cassette domain-containing protein [Helicobacter sp.]MDY5615484.1 ATP-binding cassette domain-containing protein [Helicobacter sp.]RAX52187.1 sulfate ABC transporter ATP-binding protein [Helicobacter sp. 11-8110]
MGGLQKESLIEVKNLYTGYGKNIIHDGVSFEVYSRDIFALLGGSGSGKSTLLNTMIFLKKPIGGEVRILGKEIWGLDAKETLAMKLNFGVLFQFGALFSSLNVLDNLTLPLCEYTKFDKQDRENLAYFWLTRVGLNPEVAKLYPSELSGGMVKRVGLARALSLSPKILFLDEPTSGLDPRSARHFDALIKELRDLLGISIVMVTHDMESVKGVVDRMVVLKDKKVFFQGSLEELRAQTDSLDLFLHQI